MTIVFQSDDNVTVYCDRPNNHSNEIIKATAMHRLSTQMYVYQKSAAGHKLDLHTFALVEQFMLVMNFVVDYKFKIALEIKCKCMLYHTVYCQ